MLLVVWLTATQHCALAATGLLGANHGEQATSCCSDSEQHCSHDGCEVVEGGSVSTPNSSIKVPLPEVQAGLFLFCVQLIAPSVILTEPSSEFAEGIERPLDWVPTWHFERRAAPSPRAPSLILA
jgi:hypothetical protein